MSGKVIILIINIALGAVFLFFLLRYLRSVIREGVIRPEQWGYAVRNGKVSRRLLRYKRFCRDKSRFFSWWLQVERLKREHIEGDFAELGVYKGKSARLIHQMDTERTFHLFDTFRGFRDEDLLLERGEALKYRPSDFADTSVESVQARLMHDPAFVFHVGNFPESTFGLEDARFALVSIDADLYRPTLDGLWFFYPRLAPGGAIFVHDYNYRWEGVCRAVDEFSALIPEVPVFLPDKYGSILIVKNRKQAESDGKAEQQTK